jgi:hypothetical protein
MERSQLFDLMGELKLYGMKAAFDEIMATAVNVRRRSRESAVAAVINNFVKMLASRGGPRH